MPQDTFIARQEEIVEDVARWCLDYVNTIVDAVAPDGRPFQMEKKSEAEQLREYVTTLRGRPYAWREKVQQYADQIVMLLREAKVPEDDIASVSPYTIAESFAVAHSAKYERLLRKYRAKDGLRSGESGESESTDVDSEDGDAGVQRLPESERADSQPSGY